MISFPVQSGPLAVAELTGLTTASESGRAQIVIGVDEARSE